MSAADRSRIHAEDELLGARAWALRHEVSLTWLPDALTLRVELVQPLTNELFYLRGVLTDYRELPPEWTFCSESWDDAESLRRFPKPPADNRTPFGPSLFITFTAQSTNLTKGVICAHFNRIAHGAPGVEAPHANWGGAAQWLTTRPKEATATSLGEMLAVIHRDFQFTSGRKDHG